MDLSHFQNENFYHSINQLMFCVQNPSDFKYISYNLFKNADVNIKTISLILFENGLKFGHFRNKRPI